MTEPPRIWTLESSVGTDLPLCKPSFPAGEVLVVEAAPVAELLERWLKAGLVQTTAALYVESEALLAALRASQGTDAVKHESRPS